MCRLKHSDGPMPRRRDFQHALDGLVALDLRHVVLLVVLRLMVSPQPQLTSTWTGKAPVCASNDS